MAAHRPDPAAPVRAAFSAPETKNLDIGVVQLELGSSLPVSVAYREWGKLNAAGDNAVIVCHALTGNADADRWWGRMFGPGRALDLEKDYVLCSNILGSCYGTTGPTSIEPGTGLPWRGRFPQITVRDMVRVQAELARRLGVKRIRLVVGGSLGGMQTLEWGFMYPELVEAIVPIACSARHSAWCIGISEAQRQTNYADPRWLGGHYEPAEPPSAGLAAARMAAMITYRSMPSFEQRFGRRAQAADVFAVESYLRYQGQQLVDRFDAATYVTLTRAMDTHDVSRGRGDFDEVLRSVKLPTLVISIDSDALYLPEEQRAIADGIPGARFERLESQDGHDAFLIDVDRVSQLVAEFRGRPAEVRAPRAAVRSGGEPVNAFVLGKGKVGSELLEQVAHQRRALERDYDLSLRVVGLADTKRRTFDEGGIELSRWRDVLAAGDAAGPVRAEDAPALLDRLARLPKAVLVDVTAADGMEAVYAEAFRRGIHVVSANKRPLVVPFAERERLSVLSRQSGSQWHYDPTVGASLPLIRTIDDVVRTGDRVHLLEGSLSGTLGFVTGEMMKGSPLSLAVRWARELGYAEADPRDDLSGLDSARKAVILAREMGYAAEVSEVRVTPLVSPEALEPGTFLDLVSALRRADEEFARRCNSLAERGRSLRYLAKITAVDGRAEIEVGPVEVDSQHRAARLRGVEAYVELTTERHDEAPLAVQGTGVGGALTAGAVLAELLRIAGGRGAR
jgi:homoserine O-acetyltransferase